MAESGQRSSAALFDVFLRLRPSFAPNAARFLDVEETETEHPTHITIRPPVNDHRKRAIEKFEFTRVFQEDAAQLDLFRSVGLPQAIQGVLGQDNSQGRDGLLATLGVTGSGKVDSIVPICGTNLTPSRATPYLDQRLSGVLHSCHWMFSFRAYEREW